MPERPESLQKYIVIILRELWDTAANLARQDSGSFSPTSIHMCDRRQSQSQNFWIWLCISGEFSESDRQETILWSFPKIWDIWSIFHIQPTLKFHCKPDWFACHPSWLNKPSFQKQKQAALKLQRARVKALQVFGLELRNTIYHSTVVGGSNK